MNPNNVYNRNANARSEAENGFEDDINGCDAAVEFPLLLDETKSEQSKWPAPRVDSSKKDNAWMDNFFAVEDSLLDCAHDLRQCESDYPSKSENNNRKKSSKRKREISDNNSNRSVLSDVAVDQRPSQANDSDDDQEEASLEFSQQLLVGRQQPGDKRRRQMALSSMLNDPNADQTPLDPLFTSLRLCETAVSTNLTIEMLRQSEEPTLLTLTSFPFRVAYANEAYRAFSGQKDIVGQPFFESFASDDMLMKPSFALYPSLLQMLENGTPHTVQCRPNSYEDTVIACSIQAFPVTESKKTNNPSKGGNLRYYAIRFRSLDE